MGSLRESILEHIKNKQSINPTQISLIQDRLTNIISQFHTPNHPPYAAMIQRALQELNQKGGSTEKSISEFIKTEYDDLPWAHCSLLKHHLGLLSKDGEILLTRFRYSLCGAHSSLVSTKGEKKHRKKKGRWKLERSRTKRLKLTIAVRPEKENEFDVIKDPSQVNDRRSEVAGQPVIETEKGPNDGIQSPVQGGTLLQSKDMNTDSPLLVLKNGRKNQVRIEQQLQENCHLKINDSCDLHAPEMHEWNSNEDAILEHSTPERPPGFEFMGVEECRSQECSLVNSPPLQIPEVIATDPNMLTAPTISHLPPEKKEQPRNAPPTPIAKKSLQQMHEKKKGRHPEVRQFGKMLEQHEIVLALPYLPKGSLALRDLAVQNERSQRQSKCWRGKLSNVRHTVKALCSSENSGKCPPGGLTSDVEKSQVLEQLSSEYTIMTRRRAKFSSLPRQSGAQPQLASASFSSSKDFRQDEGCDSQGVCQSTYPLALPQQDEDMPLRKYQRRGRRPKAKTKTTLQDESPTTPTDIQKQKGKEPSKLLCYHIPQAKTSETVLSKEEVTGLNLKDHSEKEHQLEPSKSQRRSRPSKRMLVVNKGEGAQSSKRRKLKKSSNRRSKKQQKKC